MKEILERIAKSLESIDAELKARNADRKKLLEEAEQIEKKVIEIQADPFGLENLKAAALADKAKKKGWQKKHIAWTMRLPKKTYLHYITFNEKRQEYNMTYLIIATIILALTEIIVLPFASKRLSIFDWEDVEDETI